MFKKNSGLLTSIREPIPIIVMLFASFFIEQYLGSLSLVFNNFNLCLNKKFKGNFIIVL